MKRNTLTIPAIVECNDEIFYLSSRARSPDRPMTPSDYHSVQLRFFAGIMGLPSVRAECLRLRTNADELELGDLIGSRINEEKNKLLAMTLQAENLIVNPASSVPVNRNGPTKSLPFSSHRAVLEDDYVGFSGVGESGGSKSPLETSNIR